jgi:hypothetical protein
MTITMVHITLLAAGLATLAASPAYATDAAWAPQKGRSRSESSGARAGLAAPQNGLLPQRRTPLADQTSCRRRNAAAAAGVRLTIRRWERADAPRTVGCASPPHAHASRTQLIVR